MSRYRCEKISCVNEVQCGTRTERSDLIDQQRDLEVSDTSPWTRNLSGDPSLSIITRRIQQLHKTSHEIRKQ